MQICSANSRVGARTRARGRRGSARSTVATSGMPKARVLPEPVGARPQMSRPSSASVMVAAWMAKGSVMPQADSARVMDSGTPSWAKVVDIGSPVPRIGG